MFAAGDVDKSPCGACCAEWEGGTWYHAPKCPVAKALRDEYCTPKELAKALGRFTLDVASNSRSQIVADKVCGPAHPLFANPLAQWLGPDSLKVSWVGEDLFCNGPFSNLLPFAEKLHEARSFVFLCNTDHSTKWWKAAVAAGGVYRFDLDRRQQFDPPPHIRRSTNNKPQSLLCNWAAAVRIDKGLRGMGQWWMAREEVPSGHAECSG